MSAETARAGKNPEVGAGRTGNRGGKPSALDTRLIAALASRKERSMLRSLDPAPSSSSSSKPLVDFSSNDYLSLSQHPTLRSNLLRTLTSPSFNPYGPPSSRLLDGNTPSHLSLESRLSAFFRAPAALLFNSGFDANAGLWASLPGPEDYIVFDELVHASMHDGMRASRAPKERRRAFGHNDLDALERALREIVDSDVAAKRGEKSVWIGVESLYSMDGDLAPLKEMVELVERVLPAGNGHLIVDEAHSSGLYGPSGRGFVCALGLEERITVRVHTFGKAMACSGAAVLTSPLLRSYLINYARPLIYSTTMTHMSVAAISESLGMLERGEGEDPAARVHRLARLLITSLASSLPPNSPVSLPPHAQLIASSPSPSSSPSEPASGPPPPPPTSPILPLLTPHPRPLAAHLLTLGYLCRPITYPTVPKGEERVRVCLHAGNTQGEVSGLVEGVVEWAKTKGERGVKAKL